VRQVGDCDSFDRDVRLDVHSDGGEIDGLEVGICVDESFQRRQRERRRREDRGKPSRRPATSVTARTFTVERRVQRAGDPPDAH